MSDITAGLLKMREKFPPHQISQLPKGGVMLDFVGHAALTDRLLDADPAWNWEPLHIDPATGLPALDAIGGLWIKLTVCGVTRLGYGDAGDKKGCNAMKERIGDALRNAAMRFGAALDLWHKGDLHADAQESPPPETRITSDQAAEIREMIDHSGVDRDKFLGWLGVSSTTEIPADRYESATNALLNRIAKNEANAAAQEGANYD